MKAIYQILAVHFSDETTGNFTCKFVVFAHTHLNKTYTATVMISPISDKEQPTVLTMLKLNVEGRTRLDCKKIFHKLTEEINSQI